MRKRVLVDAGLGGLGSALAEGGDYERVDTIALRCLHRGWVSVGSPGRVRRYGNCRSRTRSRPDHQRVPTLFLKKRRSV